MEFIWLCRKIQLWRVPERSGSRVVEGRLEAICRRYHVVRLAVFGSVLREDFGPDSDVDMLVEFEPGMTPGFGFIRLERELSDLVGRPVDLVTFKALNRHLREDVLR